MIFKKLTLENFKSHVKSVIEFKKGTTIILGENGAGKSSVFEGINFALYKKYNTKSLNDLINSNANKMTVSLEFIAGSQVYKATRTRTASKSTATLSQLSNDNDFTTIVEGDKEVTSYIESLLEMDSDLFANAIYIKQGEIDSLVTQKASERKKNISKLLRLENLEVSYKNIATVISNYEFERKRIAESITDDADADMEELEAEKTRLVEEEGFLNIQVGNIQKEIEEVKNVIAELTAANISYNMLTEKKNDVAIEIERREARLQVLKEQLDELVRIEMKIVDIDDVDYHIGLIDNIIDAEDSLEDIKRKRQFALEKMNYFVGELALFNRLADVYSLEHPLNEEDYTFDSKKADILANTIQNDLQCTADEHDRVSKDVHDLDIGINMMKKDVLDQEQFLKTLDETEGICPICHSQIDDEHKKQLRDEYNVFIADKREKIEKRQHEYDILMTERLELEGMLKEKKEFVIKTAQLVHAINNLRKHREDYDICEEQCAAVRKQIEKWDNELDTTTYIPKVVDNIRDLKQYFVDMQREQRNYREKVDEKESIEVEHYKEANEIKDLQDRMAELEAQIKDNPYDVELFQKLQKKQADLQSEYLPLSQKYSKVNGDVRALKMRLQIIEDQIKENEINKGKLEKYDDFIDLLKDIRECYSKDGLQKDIRVSFKPQVQKYTNEFFAKFGFDYSSLVITDDYDIAIMGPSGESNATMISGGEKIAVALALRLGISQAISMSDIECLLLDEPTTYLDSVRKQEFVEIIQNISLVPQMIIITHDEQLENSSENMIIIRKDMGKSEVVQ